MSSHAKLSPSSAHRWRLCPGSVREEAKYPEQTGPAAIDGTRSHLLLEKCLIVGHSRLNMAFSFIDTRFEDDNGGFTVDSDRANRVAMAIDYINNKIGEGKVTRVQSERRVDLKYLTGRDDLGGTIDVQIDYVDGSIEIIDYKDGMNAVPVDNNQQLIQYAIGVLSELGGNDSVHTIRTTIIQPKLALKGINPISSFDYNTNDLMLLATTALIVDAKATDDINAPLIPGESQCKYCRAKGSCSALSTHTFNTLEMFTPLDFAQQGADKDPASLNNEQLQQIIEAIPLLREFFDAVEEEALRRMKNGETVPGLKVVKGNGSRNWSLDDEQMVDKLVKMGIPKSEVYVSKLVSPAQVEKLNWVKRNGEKKQLSKIQIERLNNEYVTKSDGKLKVVPESDSRPAVVFDVSYIFNAVKSEESELPSWLKLEL